MKDLVEATTETQPRTIGALDLSFGGMKHSGNGREGGTWGLEEFLEVKAVSDWE